MRVEDITNPTIEALDHAVGLRGSLAGLSDLDTEGFTELVEVVSSSR